MMKQYSIYDIEKENYIISKPIRLIELFGGYGSQNLTLKYLTGKSCHYKLVEWASKSIQAYNDLHIQDYTDYSQELTDEEVLNKLLDLGVSYDYNAPMTMKQLKLKDYRKIYNNIKATDNLVDISRVHASDLEITNTDKYCYLMSYSFPCQDLSLAGECKGMARDSGTRSSLLWQVERILKECKESNCLPQVLLMENVTQVHGSKNKDNFNMWLQSLESLGYQNFWQDLNAKDYGIPQNRNRTFMISVLNGTYEFPKKMELKLRLKDLLEDIVDEKYYLSQMQLEMVEHWNSFQKPLETMKRTNENNIAPTLTTRTSAFAAGMILIGGIGEKKSNNNTQWYLQDRVYSSNGVALNVNASVNPNYQIELKRGYQINVKEESDDSNNIDIIGNYSKSNFNQTSIVGKNGIAPTVTENHGQVTAIAIKNNTKQGYLLAEEGDGIDISSRMVHHRGTVQKGKTQTIKTDGGNSVGVVTKNLAIRKLTPRECFRLQGLVDEDTDKIVSNQTDSSAYHLAGDSICVSVLIGIFGKLLGLTDNEIESKIRNLYSHRKE